MLSHQVFIPVYLSTLKLPDRVAAVVAVAPAPSAMTATPARTNHRICSRAGREDMSMSAYPRPFCGLPQISSSCVVSLVRGINIQSQNRDPAVPGRNLMRDLLARALNDERPSEHEPERAGGQSAFSDAGYALGSDELERTDVPDPNVSSRTQVACVCVSHASAAEETAIRHPTFWCDGFSVEDGEPRRYDDPSQAQILSEITAG
jgi:hypothetical protein